VVSQEGGVSVEADPKEKEETRSWLPLADGWLGDGGGSAKDLMSALGHWG
jgi:hypothetical protein